jgi:hypothetical protein
MSFDRGLEGFQEHVDLTIQPLDNFIPSHREAFGGRLRVMSPEFQFQRADCARTLPGLPHG